MSLHFALVLFVPGAVAQTDTPKAAYVLPVSTAEPKLDYEADEADYDRRAGLLRLHGGVRVWDEEWTLKSDLVRFDLNTRRAKGAGFVLLEDKESAVWGDSGTFDFRAHEGELENASGGYRPWYVQAKSLQVEDKLHLYRRVSFTSCSAVPEPHFHLRASRLTVFPKHYVTATNVRVYLGDVPVFYFPYFYSSLAGHRFFSTTFRLGYSGRNGGELQSTTLLRFHPAFYARGFVDYYTEQGFGTGAELNHSAAETARSSLYAYRIREPDGVERWTVLGSQFQSLGSPYSLQARLQLQSDPTFNNHYSRSNFFRVTPELRNAVALVRQTDRTTARVAYDRLDAALGTGFRLERESKPRFDFNTAPLRLFGGGVQNVAAFAEQGFDRAHGFDRSEAGASWQAQRTFALGRGVTFVPRTAVSTTFADRLLLTGTAGAGVLRDAVVTRYGAGGLARWSTFAGDLDLDFEQRWRSRSQELEPDRAADDRGVELSRLGLVHFWRPHRRAYTRFQTGYDFRGFRTLAPRTKERFEPVRAELNIRPRPLWSVSIVDEYELDRGNRSVLLQSDWGDPEGDRVGLGVFQSDASADRAIVSHSASWGRGPWRLTGAIRYQVGGGDLDMYEKLVSLDRSFHDFQTFWLFRDRTGATEFQFRIHLRFTYEKKTAETRLDAEREWYPWRQKPDDR